MKERKREMEFVMATRQYVYMIEGKEQHRVIIAGWDEDFEAYFANVLIFAKAAEVEGFKASRHETELWLPVETVEELADVLRSQGEVPEWLLDKLVALRPQDVARRSRLEVLRWWRQFEITEHTFSVGGKHLGGFWEVVVGWDGCLETFFAHVWDVTGSALGEKDADETLELSAGMRAREVETVEELDCIVRLYAEIPDDILSMLRDDKAGPTPPPSL
jgi:hypothetical protein